MIFVKFPFVDEEYHEFLGAILFEMISEKNDNSFIIARAI